MMNRTEKKERKQLKKERNLLQYNLMFLDDQIRLGQHALGIVTTNETITYEVNGLMISTRRPETVKEIRHEVKLWVERIQKEKEKHNKKIEEIEKKLNYEN